MRPTRSKLFSFLPREGNVFTPVCDSVHGRGASVQRGVSVKRGSLPRDLCPGGPLFRSLCPAGLCPGGSLSGGSLSRGVSVQGISVWGVSVQGGLCSGALVRWVSVQGDLCPGRLCLGGFCPGVVSVRETPPRQITPPHMVKTRRYASYWNPLLFLNFLEKAKILG